jgi:signal peptidase II
MQRSANIALITSCFYRFNLQAHWVIDLFYRVILTGSQEQLNYFSDQPYGTWFHGQVVDMFYFPFWQGSLPGFVLGGKRLFFNAIILPIWQFQREWEF